MLFTGLLDSGCIYAEIQISVLSLTTLSLTQPVQIHASRQPQNRQYAETLKSTVDQPSLKHEGIAVPASNATFLDDRCLKDSPMLSASATHSYSIATFQETGSLFSPKLSFQRH